MTIQSKHEFVTALEKLHGRKLRRYIAARMRHAAADIPDLVQEVFLRLLRVSDHEAIRHSQAYLYTVASHVLHQHALRHSVLGVPDALTDISTELGAADSDPAAQLEVEQQFEQIGGELLEQHPRAYATLILHRCEGLPLQEISERFGVSYSMVKKYLAHALIYIEQRLDDGREAK